MPFPQTRMRRLRGTRALRGLVRETSLAPSDLVYPMFVAHGLDRREPIQAMPGIQRLSIAHAVDEAGEARETRGRARTTASPIPARPARPRGADGSEWSLRFHMLSFPKPSPTGYGAKWRSLLRQFAGPAGQLPGLRDTCASTACNRVAEGLKPASAESSCITTDSALS